MYQSNLISSIGPTQSSPANEQMGSGDSATVPLDGGNNNPNIAVRQRLRWTNELHDRFVEAVTQLGGPDSKSLLLQLVFFCLFDTLWPDSKYLGH